MFPRLLFIAMRGLSLFSVYLRNNLISMVALGALFTLFHTMFAIGFAMTDFASGIARFDTIRVYAPQEQMAGLSPLFAAVKGILKVKVYTPSDTKEYIEKNAPSLSSVHALPEELFPSFAELTVNREMQTVESLRELSQTLSALPGVDSVSYGESWAEQMAKGKKAVFTLVALAAVLFGTVGGVIIYQTISVTLFRYKKEVHIYSIVGGTSAFITLPFVVVAGCMALLCALFSMMIYFLLHFFLLRPVAEATGLPISLTFTYWVLFIFITAAVSKAAGYISADSFLRRGYYEE